MMEHILQALYQKGKWMTNLLFLLFYVMPFMDSLNGFLLLELQVNMSVGRLYRIAVILLAFLIIAACWQTTYFQYSKLLFWLLLLAIVFVGITLLHLYWTEPRRRAINMAATWLFLPLLMCAFYCARKSGWILQNAFEKIFLFYAWSYSLLVLIPGMLNLGFSTYPEGIGHKGFFYANNAISYALCILMIYTCTRFFQKPSWKYALPCAAVATASLMIGTKSCLASILLAFIVALFAILKKISLKTGIILGCAFAALLCIVLGFSWDKLVSRFAKISGIYHGNLVNIITSGRIHKTTAIWKKVLKSAVFPFNLLFGAVGLGKVAEMDIVDLFFNYGLYGGFAYILSLIQIQKRMPLKSGLMLTLVLFTLCYSLIVGHIFTNAMSSMLFALILSAGWKTELEEKECSAPVLS